MNIDWVLWVVRAIIIVVGIIMAIMVLKRKREYYFGISVIGITAFILGVLLLIVSLITDLSSFYGLYLTAAGVIALIIGLVIRNRLKKNR